MREKSRYSNRSRLILLLAGLLILCLAVILIGAAIWPLEETVQQGTLSPTLFLPP